jgi:hypothetical protein
MSELQFHPLAALFPLIDGEELDALVADIKANGLREKIDLYQGKVVDGRNRYRALQRLGIDPSSDQKQYFRKALYAHTTGGEIAPHEQDNDARVLAYIISKNIHRRHLTAEQKRDLIAKVIAAKPEASDRQIAKQVKADHKTVGSVRAEREATGEVSPVEKRVGADGKARKRPAKKAKGWGRIVLADEGRCATAQESAALRAQWAAEGRTPDNPEGAMPTEEEAEESYQDTLYDQACVLLERMTDETRQLFFAHLRGKYLNALGKPLSPSYDPKYKVKTPLTSINRLRVKPPKIRDAPPQDIGNEHIKEWDALEPADEHVIDYYSVMEEAAFSNAPPPDVSAETMKAKIAALDDGLDIPESFRRGATA